MKHKETSDLSKSAWDVVKHAKDTTQQNLTVAVANGVLKLDRALLPALLALISSSIDQGAIAALKEFEMQADRLLDKKAAPPVAKKK